MTGRRRIPDAVRHRLDEDLERARQSERVGEYANAWSALEDAHVLSQPWATKHVRVHWLMLRLGVMQRDAREAVGQLIRLAVAAPGSVTGRYPVGNNGRARVRMTKPMALAPDVAELLEREQ
jgi:hypothetical protein